MEFPKRSSDTCIRLSPIQGKGIGVSWARVREWLGVALLVVVALLLRLDFMRGGSFVIDADEAIVGLMGKHILEGRGVPTFYYGQHYMGSLEGICASIVFRLLGISSFTLQLVPLVFSLVLVYLMYLLGRSVGGVTVGRVAALLCAVPPAPLIVWSFKARGGFIELLVIGALSLLFTVRWLKKTSTNLTYPALIWLTLGVGWWVNNQIVYFIVPIGLFGALKSFASLRAGRLSLVQVGKLSVVSVVSFCVGSAPYWIYNVRHGFPSLGMFGFAPLSDMREYFIGLFSNALPIILGAKHFWENDSAFPGATLVVSGVYATLFCSVLWARRSSLGALRNASLDRIEPLEIFLFFIPFTCVVFAVSSFGWLSQAPRYLLPLYVGVFVVCGWFVRLVSSRSKVLGCLSVLVLVGLNLASAYAGGRAIPGEPVVFNGERVSRDHSEIIGRLKALGIHKIRTNYWIGYRLAFETNEDVTFLVFEAPKQIRISEYEQLERPHDRITTPLVLVPSERDVFAPGLRKLGYSFKEEKVSGYSLLYDISLMEPRGTQIGRSLIQSVHGWGANSPEDAVDGNLHTRWGTGGHQRADQTFSIALAQPIKVSGIDYDLGDWSQDYPRGLRVDIESPDGRVLSVLGSDEYRQVMPLGEPGKLRLSFPAVLAKRVVLTQTGNHPILDWSIAELRLLTPVSATESKR